MATFCPLERSASHLTESNSNALRNYLAPFLSNAMLWSTFDIMCVFCGAVNPSCHWLLLILDLLIWACFGLCRLLVSLQPALHQMFTRYGGCSYWRSAAPIQCGVFDQRSCVETVE